MWYIILAVWLIGAIITYIVFDKKTDVSVPVKIAASALWPATIIFYIIHYFHNKE